MDGKKNEKRVITLITEDSLQASLLKESLEKHLNVIIKLTPLTVMKNEESETAGAVSDIVIIDMSVYSSQMHETYADHRSLYFPDAEEVLINCKTDVCYQDLAQWGHLIGVFYVSDDLDLLTRGIDKIMQGEMWLSRKLSQEYILYFRGRHTAATSHAYNSLTKREQQIIKLLGHGDSNHQIADKLFVSENTVKTHLHNVFKKINAKNRLQALLWAKENISDIH
ncbi:helix-turn-helix transcriptional regulator [Vibrio albus]|uniref:Helix-turn-helix transcriptional regulator n=1 Tax=Vibrio albus TaxID=2200953 RepID=A0A2U3B7D0_9VIBR|nr:LuxR C-terminal-related transcriptional regulator [Vibrio albus]PWI32713.1 helix-turn-helix transcriptional regulator [Vibrio albus]